MAFQSMLSETKTMLKKIWDNLSESINQIQDWIEKQMVKENTYLIEINNAKNWLDKVFKQSFYQKVG
ncbi:unnamed protein product [Paramecium sonneborni]|uniref:Uncharacterized protein n=1 Tax=Paramecium sonneborni TaxID=65129 RepID=A0A8S1QXZ5_9CILI|nr:unnamed protein product [Paramecium sonneborni]